MITIDNDFQNLIPPLTDEEFAQLEKNILRDGIRDALITWHGILIDGHNRYRIAQKYGLTYRTVEKQFTDRNDAERWIILNQFGRRNLSAYDRSILALKLKPIIAEKAKENQLANLKNTEVQKSAPRGKTRDELANIAGVSHDTIAKVEKIQEKATPEIKSAIKAGEMSINQAYQIVKREEKKQEVVEDDFDEEPPAEPIAKIGDIYQLGKHRLMCGDALSDNDVKTLLNGNVCELTFTDPPYEIGEAGGGIIGKSNHMKQIKTEKVDKFNPEALFLYSETNIYCHNKPLIKKYIELAEVNHLPYDLCFYKKQNTAPNYGGHLMTDCEYIAVIGKQAPNKGLPKETYSKCFIGKKDKGNELSYSKPIELCAKYIRLYGKQNILDLFGGSGSTLIACEQLGKTCFMMELDPKYVDVIINRWEQFTGQKAVKLNAD